MAFANRSAFRVKLMAAFAEMRDSGMFARQNWQCCMSCGCAAIPDKYKKGYVFYHGQEATRLAEIERKAAQQRTTTKTEDVGVQLCYGAGADGDEADAVTIGQYIAFVLRKHGLGVDWDGDASKKIWVHDRKSADAE
jgi:hypothetical protein